MPYNHHVEIHILSQHLQHLIHLSLDLLVLVFIFLVFVLPLLLPLLGFSDEEEGAGHLDTDLSPDLPVPPVGLGLPLLLTLRQALTEKRDAVGSLAIWIVGSRVIDNNGLPLAVVMEQAGNWPYKHKPKVISRILESSSFLLFTPSKGLYETKLTQFPNGKPRSCFTQRNSDDRYLREALSTFHWHQVDWVPCFHT